MLTFSRTKQLYPQCLASAIRLAVTILACLGSGQAQTFDSLPGTKPLTLSGDLSAQMVAGINRFLLRETTASVSNRQKLWHRNFSSREAYETSISSNRLHFRNYIGAIDPRLPIEALEYTGNTLNSSKLGESGGYSVYAVRWPVLDGVHGEGLMLQPKGKVRAFAVVLPDADQTPEQLLVSSSQDGGYPAQLAAKGCLVVIPTIINREDTYSGNPAIGRFTNQPHREWIYRQAFEMGRHIIGYEVQKVLALVDWVYSQKGGAATPIGVAGYGEGGLIAFYSAALDSRITTALVSGYFAPRESVWQEPIYRNVWGLLEEFGDAEIASLIAPRKLVIEHSRFPVVNGPPPSKNGRGGAAPGKITTPSLDEVRQEVRRAASLLAKDGPLKWEPELVGAPNGALDKPGSKEAIEKFLAALGITTVVESIAGSSPLQPFVNPAERQHRQVKELEDFTQHLLLISDRQRRDFFWSKIKPGNDWEQSTKPFKEQFWSDVIGRFPAPTSPANPRARKVTETDKWVAHEVVLDVWPDVYAWGYLLLPKDLKPGERRPVVVCQHGLEGVPNDTISGPGTPGYNAYKSFAARLAEQGFITFAPHNPYRGEDRFRELQRMANPLRKSLFSIILAQHEQILNWLSSLPMVDPTRIGFYGLSYGGKTAVRVPALLDRYCLSICSADFNDWVKKIVTTESGYSYMYTGEYELMEWNLGNTFNYAEMTGLIAPRPFMVERGHDDGVAPDEWVAYEYARTRRAYAKLGIADRTKIEFFDGPHTINGIGTFEFLRHHLNWPEKKMSLELLPCGPNRLFLRFASQVGDEAFERSQRLMAELQKSPPPGLIELVPAFTTLLLEFDAKSASELTAIREQLLPHLEQTLIETGERPTLPVKEIPVTYDGPDLERVAKMHGLTTGEVSAIHAQTIYKVYQLGFAPGFPYLGDLDTRLHTPRLASPRPKVRAGSVAIGGEHTGIYPNESPGGWNIIGHTTVKLFDPRLTAAGTAEQMFFLHPGDQVRFIPIA